METQLAFDDQDKQLGLRFREKLVTDLGIVCKVQRLSLRRLLQLPVAAALSAWPGQVRGLLNTVTGGVNWDAHLWKAFHPLQKPPAVHSRYLPPRAGQPSPLALMAGATYHSGSDEVLRWLRAKQQLRTPGAWRLKLRGTLQYPAKSQEVCKAEPISGQCMLPQDQLSQACMYAGDGAWRHPAQSRSVQLDTSPGRTSAGRLQSGVAAQPAARICRAPHSARLAMYACPQVAPYGGLACLQEPYCQLRENNWSLNFVQKMVGKRGSTRVRNDL